MNLNITATSYLISDNYLEINDKQSLILSLLIRDDHGNLYTPTVLRWQLTDTDGNILNGRSFNTTQTVFDKVILDYHDTKIIEVEYEDPITKKILSIAAGVTIDGINYQYNSEIQIKIKETINSFPDIYSDETDGLDVPFDNLDSPFINLDSTF